MYRIYGRNLRSAWDAGNVLAGKDFELITIAIGKWKSEGVGGGGGGGMEKAMQEDVCMFLKHKHHGLNFDLGYAKLWPFCCVT